MQGLLCHFNFSGLVTLLLINIHNLLFYHRVVSFAIIFSDLRSIESKSEVAIVVLNDL